jgi:hypothetical protein
MAFHGMNAIFLSRVIPQKGDAMRIGFQAEGLKPVDKMNVPGRLFSGKAGGRCLSAARRRPENLR